MKKEKVIYRFNRYIGKTLYAKKEMPFEISLNSRMLLDELCFKENKKRLEQQLNTALDQGNAEAFHKLSEAYKQYVWE
ncbi:IDEAL domain-containing protein [Virgibacillus halophilus]|uniref:IDEAL domain-containing protein n=1 Tax=Tigheibacillus halophilus TaxID=361280 RepID=A0ABU5C9J2_9BACI|nr:IDEAL domain-containing protein [Virgibacillus halophilus]